jgi:signal peptidase
LTDRFNILRRVAGTLAVAALLALGVLMLLPAAFGLKRYVLAGGSMAGSYDRGSIVYERAVPASQLRAGDVITYTPPPSAGVPGRVTHRIVWAGRDRRGVPTFRTKGDANASPDPWLFTLSRPTQPRVAFAVPLVGYAFAALGIRWVRMVVIGLPALLVAISALTGLRPGSEEAVA